MISFKSRIVGPELGVAAGPDLRICMRETGLEFFISPDVMSISLGVPLRRLTFARTLVVAIWSPSESFKFVFLVFCGLEMIMNLDYYGLGD